MIKIDKEEKIIVNALLNSKYLKSETKRTVKSKKKEIIEKIIRGLDNDEKSPFFQEIDHSIRSFDKKGSIIEKNGSKLRLFPKKCIFDMINDIIQDIPFFFSDYLIFEKNIDRYIDFLIDYFTAIKCVFSQEWVDIYSVIRRNVGIFAIGKLLSSIWSNSFNRLNSDDRMLRIIESLLSWKNNNKFIDLSSNSILNHQFPEELKRNINKIYPFFLRGLLDSLFDNQMFRKEAKNILIEFKNKI